jgi:hypothetical protein
VGGNPAHFHKGEGMCMKIKAICEIEYDVKDVMRDYKNDYPDVDFGIDDAKSMIHQWIKDDFGCLLMDYKVEEINA